MKTHTLYVGYVLYLERYLHIDAETEEDAFAMLKRMARDGVLARPTPGEMDQWTETDVMQSYFVIDHEEI